MDDSNLLSPLPPQRKKSKKGIGAALGAVGVVLLKLGAYLKFALPFAKTGISMVLMIWLYSRAWGWPFAVGFVILILVHETGHLLAAKAFGLPVSAPIFIPFMGAFIALKNAPKDAWMEACVGIGGPALGTLGALACAGLYPLTGNPLYLAIAYSAFFLNLFNLIPITPLDGGRIAAAISPWLWAVGVAILGAALWMGWLKINFVLVMILILCGLRVLKLFRGGSNENPSYFSVSLPRRCLMAAMYISLAIILVLGMSMTRVVPQRRAEQFSLASSRLPSRA
jgi:Zn-dependent protease